MCRRPDAGKLQQVGRVDGATGQDHFTAGTSLDFATALAEADADAAPTTDDDDNGRDDD